MGVIVARGLTSKLEKAFCDDDPNKFYH